jgi:hypothetical protein
MNAVYLHTLVETKDVRGGVQTRPVAGLPQRRGDTCRDGALDVRAGDVDKFQGFFGIAERREQRPRPLKPGLASLPFHAVNVSERFLVTHIYACFVKTGATALL